MRRATNYGYPKGCSTQELRRVPKTVYSPSWTIVQNTSCESVEIGRNQIYLCTSARGILQQTRDNCSKSVVEKLCSQVTVLPVAVAWDTPQSSRRNSGDLQKEPRNPGDLQSIFSPRRNAMGSAGQVSRLLSWLRQLRSTRSQLCSTRDLHKEPAALGRACQRC